MTPHDPRLPDGLAAAVEQVKAAVASAVERVLLNLTGASQSVARVAEREMILSTQLALRQRSRGFLAEFGHGFDQRLLADMTPRTEPRRSLGEADWETLSLVDDSEVEDRMFADRLGQQMAHGCEWELRELAGYIGTLLELGRAEEDRNPLRPALIAPALYQAIESLCAEQEPRHLLAREFGSAMAQLLPACYAAIVQDLRQRHIAPMRLSFKGVEGPGNHLTGVNSGYASLQHDDPPSTRAQATSHGSAHGPAHSTSHGISHGTSHGTSHSISQHGPHAGSFAASTRGQTGAAADAQLMNLLRQLTQLATRHGDFDGAPPSQHAPHGMPGQSQGAGFGSSTAWGGEGSLMAVNLIRAHRDELMQASTGKLDHMVIDVVGSLFDQILSDPRVPPEMARQIARLQLPVLRVALVDASFFSSRRHPVRRFVNRIASLACAFDDFTRGAGEQFLARVSQLVQEIVEGDFEQVDLYTFKVAELEAFISEQTRAELQGNGATAVLESKESELQVQQRYLQQLKAALAPVTMPDYLRAFLCQVWSQALVLAARSEGADSALARRLRNVGRDVVMSVQPKGSPPMRKRFLMQLPTLMKDLTEGLALIRWPDVAKKQFLDQLLPSHAESLKGAALSELDYNLLARQLETIFAAGIPGQSTGQGAGLSTSVAELREEAPRGETAAPVAALASTEIEQRFTPSEAEQVGLVAESAVDWAEPVGASVVDIDLGSDVDGDLPDDVPADKSGEVAVAAMTAGMSADTLTGIDIDLTLTATDPAQAPSGAELMNHIRLGFAYQMLLKDEWQKVRLSFVSPGRSFFVFSRGREHKETISVTARMLARMCETQRMRAVENAYLMERATARARKQLAALRAPQASSSRH